MRACQSRRRVRAAVLRSCRAGHLRRLDARRHRAHRAAPVLIINGDSDVRTPLPGVEASVARAARRMRMGAEDKLALYLQPNAGHVFTPVAEFVMADWFVKWSGTCRQGLGIWIAGSTHDLQSCG